MSTPRSRARTQTAVAVAALIWGIACAFIPLCTGHEHGGVAVAATHGELPQQAVATILAGRAAQTGGAVATRSGLTTAQATKQLSKRCRTLLKVKRPSKLSKADKKRRTVCLKQRDKLIKESKQPSSPAPGGVIKGPEPTAPAPTGAASPTPLPTATPSPAEQTNAERCSDGNPATKCYAAVGVTAIDGGEKFGLSRGEATADIVSFELQNTDRQMHDLWIAAANAAGTEVTGTPVQITPLVAPDGRVTQEVALQPGVYVLICTVDGHGPMLVKFVVRAP